jgi:internalin A
MPLDLRARISEDGRLNLSNLELTEIPEEIKDLNSITQVDLSRNGIEAVPDFFGAMEIPYIDLSMNKIRRIPRTLLGTASRRMVNLSWNHLEVLPNSIENDGTLAWLDLSKNHIQHVPESISNLHNLRTLSLRQNRVTEIPHSVGHLAQLNDLDLSANRLKCLPGSIGNLTELISLDLSHNKLTGIPDEIGKLTALRNLNLEANPLPPELLAAYFNGLPTLRQFLTLLAVEGTPLREAKLVLVGEGEVGKSTLLAALRGEPFRIGRDSTHGIEVKPLIVGEDAKPGEEITLNAWDFGGQDVYRPTHQLFFTAPAIYLVVWKPRQGPEQGFVEYWTSLIRRRTGNGIRVHIVATHGDLHGRYAHFDQERLDQQYPGIIDGVHHVGSKSGRGIRTLKTAIATTASRFQHLDRKLPAGWLRYQAALKESGEPYLEFGEYVERAGSFDLTQESAESLARVATELGYWCYYPETSGLDDLVVLKPNWLSTAVSLVLDDDETNRRNGLIEHRRLLNVWNDPRRPAHLRYKPRVHRVLLRLMEKYEISYRISTEDANHQPTSLITQLVQERPATLRSWTEYGANLKEQARICEFIDSAGSKVIPEDLINRLIVRMHRFSLGRERHHESVHWRTGLVLDRGLHGRALIQVERDQLIVKVKAAYPQFFLDQVTEDIRDYARSYWPGLEYRNLLPCRSACKDPSRSCAGQFEIKRLFARSAKGKLHSECAHCGEDVPIDHLVTGVNDTSDALHGLASAVESALQPKFLELIEMMNSQRTQTVAELSVPLKDVASRIEERMQEILRALADESSSGPRLFTVEFPADNPWYRRATHQRLKIILWCEHSRLPLHMLGDRNRGVYEIDIPKGWIVSAAPWIRACAALLRSSLPIGLGIAKLELAPQRWAELEAGLKLTEDSLKSVAELGAQFVEEIEGDPQNLIVDKFAAPSPSQLRVLQQFLAAEDPTFGGLHRVLDRGRYLWVHDRFVGEYDPGLPEL